jgi:predicted ribosome quality control (RQC) complex YloA/Tae2 family protein
MGQRVANVYDLSEKCYLLKFAVPGNSTKVTLLLESGIRFHTTKYSRDLPELPSAFAMKLRKYIRTKRLEDVRQIGVDRVVDFKFGSGEAVNHIILELYANGNIVLTDGNYEVLALLRSHQFAEDVKLKVGEVYPIAYSTNAAAGIESTDPTLEGVTNTLASVDLAAASSGAWHSGGILAMTVEEFKQYAAQKLFEFREFHAHEELAAAAAAYAREQELAQQANPVELESSAKMTEKAKKKAAKKVLVAQMAQAAGPKKRKTKEMVLRQLLLCKDSGVSSCGPEVLDHCLLMAETKPSLRVEALEGMSEEAVSRMLGELAQAHLITDKLNTPGMPGYIAYKEPPVSGVKASAVPLEKPAVTADTTGAAAASAVPAIDPSLEFTEYLPMLLAQHMGKKFLTLPSFDEAVDEYYSKLESQRLEREAQAAELAAQKKIDKIKRDQERMQQSLVAQQERMQHGARLLEAHAEEVDKVALVINSALGAGMTWEDIAEMVKSETAAGNALRIRSVLLLRSGEQTQLHCWLMRVASRASLVKSLFLW